MTDAANPQKERTFLIFVFVLALVLRLGYLTFLQKNYFFYDHPSSDVLYYQEWAHDIASGNWIGTKTFFGLPLYPYFLAVLERLTLGNTLIIRIIHIILGSLNCVLLYLVTKKLFPAKVAVLASLLTATNFFLIYFDWIMMPVTLNIALSLVIIYGLIQPESAKNTRERFILGILLGLGICGDPKLLFFFVLATPMLYLKNTGSAQQRMGKLFPFILGVLLILSTVVLRNRIVGGDWVFISAQSGLSFYVGNNKKASGFYENPEFIRPSHTGQDEDQRIAAEYVLGKNLNPGEVSRFWRNRGLKFIRENPLDYLALLGKKLKIFLSDDERASDLDLMMQRQWRLRLDINPYTIICPLALLGIFLAWRSKIPSGTINLLLLSQLLFTLIFFLVRRHRATVLPFLIVYEAYALFWIVESALKKDYKNIFVTTAFLLSFIYIFKPVSVSEKSLAFIRHTKAGPVYEESQNFPMAQKEYLKALSMRPYDTNALFNLGNTYLYLNDFTNAEKAYLAALETCHYNVDALFNLGFTYLQTWKLKKAIHYFNEVLRYQPNSVDALYRIAQSYEKMDDCPKAVETYEKIKALYPGLSKEMNQFIADCRSSR